MRQLARTAMLDINYFQRNLVYAKEAILDIVVRFSLCSQQDTSITISLLSLSLDGASICKYFRQFSKQPSKWWRPLEGCLNYNIIVLVIMLKQRSTNSHTTNFHQRHSLIHSNKIRNVFQYSLTYFCLLLNDYQTSILHLHTKTFICNRSF